MTVNYYLKCPVCSCVTRMRSPAGYIGKTPVRIHCGECNTLLTGYFISDSVNRKCSFEATNCQSVREQAYEFYGEAAGEMLCNKIHRNTRALDDFSPPNTSPVFGSLWGIELEVNEAYIDYACYISNISENHDKNQILYNLYQDDKFDFIKQIYFENAAKSGYSLVSNFDVHRYVHFQYIFDMFGIFGKDKLRKLLLDINYEFYHLNKNCISIYKNYLIEKNYIKTAQSKMFKIMSDYIKISLNTMPALSAMLYKKPSEIDMNTLGITTCSFEDIKLFYLDAYESLVSFCHIIQCLDNIKYRNGYDDFLSEIVLDKYNSLSKGTKVKKLNFSEFFSNCFNLQPDANNLRNAIGHNDYSYNGLNQVLTYTPDPSRPNNTKTIFLLEIAMKCIDLVRSSIILEFILYELLRENYREEEQVLRLHPIFYKSTNSKNHCPCGSKKKYSKCCKLWVNNNKHSICKLELPKKSCMRLNF